MSSFRFVHAADLHLGSPFQGLALKDASIADGATVEQRTCAATPAQAFRLVAVS